MSEIQHDPLFYGMLNVFAAQVDDLEGVRIASSHRYRLLTTREEGEDGVTRGLGLGVDHPNALLLQQVIGGMKTAEDMAIRNLQNLMKKSPWGAWVKQARGVGEKQLARLLAAIGDPYWHAVQERPRRVGELWAYAGMHAVPVGEDGKPPVDGAPATYYAAPRRQRGVQANWSEEARKRVWLIATSCVKQSGGRYRDKYDETREKYAEAVHTVPCVRCGPSGHPAAAGSPLSKGHQHARALRAVSKLILKDLWIAARQMHGFEPETPEEEAIRLASFARTRKQSDVETDRELATA